MGNLLTAACGIARVHRGRLPDRCGPTGGARYRLIHRIGSAMSRLARLLLVLLLSLTAQIAAAATPAPAFVDAVDWPANGEGWEAFIDLEQRLDRDFDNICGDTFALANSATTSRCASAAPCTVSPEWCAAASGPSVPVRSASTPHRLPAFGQPRLALHGAAERRHPPGRDVSHACGHQSAVRATAGRCPADL